MTPRLPRAVYETQKGEGNRRAFKRLIDRGTVPGVLAYEGSQPAFDAWRPGAVTIVSMRSAPSVRARRAKRSATNSSSSSLRAPMLPKR